MSKRLEEMTQQELLIEIARGQRKGALSGKISAVAVGVLSIVLVITLCVYIPVVSSTLAKVQETLDVAEKVAASAEDSLAEIDEMVENLNTVIVDNTDAVAEALGHVNEVDIDSLNKSIQELSTILDPLARLFGRK